ncbi:MAG: polysaccharide export outer membrane protein [Glaciecola sp.]|jgi:polysaccharide export outer membrane protein
MRIIVNITLLVVVTLSFSSCSIMSVTKGKMFKTPLDYKYDSFDREKLLGKYTIAVDDVIRVDMYANDGYNFMSLTGGSGTSQNRGNVAERERNNSFKVRSDSTVKVPIIGKVKVVGLTLESLESYFEKLLESEFKSPFVVAEINNRRIFVFSGISQASIHILKNENTTLFDFIASSGGMPLQSNASKIKIIRGDLKDPQVYLIDLSTIEGMKKAELTMLAGDIVYIEPFINYASIITSDVLNLLSVLTTSLLVYSVFNPSN